jgi:hypothetical protein
MPSQYASELPWRLLLIEPGSYLLRDRNIGNFVEAYEPRLEQALKAMRRVEKTRHGADRERPLSCLMRESWTTKRFWFNYVARKLFDVGVLFDNCIKESDAGVESLSKEVRAGLQPFVEIKMKQLKSYDADCAKRFNHILPSMKQYSKE